jgi:hypothetical protein
LTNAQWQSLICEALQARWQGAAQAVVDAWEAYSQGSRESIGRSIKKWVLFATERRLSLEAATNVALEVSLEFQNYVAQSVGSASVAVTLSNVKLVYNLLAW